MKILRKGEQSVRFSSAYVEDVFERNCQEYRPEPRQLDSGEMRTYHMFPTFEVIHTVLPPGGKEPSRHCHSFIYEYYYVVSGGVIFEEEGSEPVSLNKGDAFVTEPSTKGNELWHRVRNASETEIAETLVVKVVADLSDIIGRDKVVEPDP